MKYEVIISSKVSDMLIKHIGFIANVSKQDAKKQKE